MATPNRFTVGRVFFTIPSITRWEFYLLRASSSSRGGCAGLYHAVINPQKNRGHHAKPSEKPPHPLRLVQNFAVVVHHVPRDPSPRQRPNSNRHKRKSHVGPLLARRR